MKRLIIFIVSFIAVFAVNMKMYSIDSPEGPNYYCKYDVDRGVCDPSANGSACYLVNEDCSWMN